MSTINSKRVLALVAATLIIVTLIPQLPKVFATNEKGRWHADRPRMSLFLNDRTENMSVDDEATVGIGVDFQSYGDDVSSAPFSGDDGFTLPIVATANTRKTINYLSDRYGSLVNGFPSTQGMQDTGICTDDGGVWEDLGFGFYFYGGPGPNPSCCYDKVWISSNGFVSFQDALTSPSLRYGTMKPNAVIAPYWTDLNPTGGGHIWYQAIGSPYYWFWVVWENVLNKMNGQRETFALWLDGSYRSPTWTRGQSAIHFLYQTVHSSGQGAVVVENQDGHRGFSPLPDEMGSTLHTPSDEIYIYGITDAPEIRELDIVCTKSDGQAKILMQTGVAYLKGYNMKFDSPTEDPGKTFEHALSGSATLLIETGVGILSTAGGLMFETLLLGYELVGDYAKEQYPAKDPVTLDAQQGDSVAYANVTAYFDGPYLYPVDATLCDIVQWILTDQNDNQFHSMAITAILKYHSYSQGDRILSTSVILEVEPDVGDTLATSKTIGLGSSEWCIDNVDFVDAFKISVPSDYDISLTLQPPNDSKFDLYLYAPGSNENSQPIASTTNPGNSSVSIEYQTTSSGIYFIKAKQTTWQGHINMGLYWLSVDVSTGGGGGCPYVFAWNGRVFGKDNNILLASETGNGTDVKDYYLLQQPVVPIRIGQQTSLYSLQIREFENEQDFIDQVKLMAVDHSSNANIATTPEGGIITYTTPASPLTCFDNNNASQLSEISRMDGNVFDPSTYFQGNEGDWLLLDFGRVTTANANLILRDDYKCMDVCINVQVPNVNGSWQTVEVLHPRDSWAIEAVNMTAYLPANNDFIVRLLWTSTHRLDYVGLDTSLPATIQVYSTVPTLAVHSTLGNVTQNLLYDDENCVELVSGQRITLAFAIPNTGRGLIRDFIFYTDGYYYSIDP